MGRRTPDEFLGREAAAELLECSISTLGHLVRRGALLPHYKAQRKVLFFRKSDVEALKYALSDDAPDLREVKALALQALAGVRRTEERLAEIGASLGIDILPLPRDLDSIATMYREAQQNPLQEQLESASWLQYWGSRFFAMDDIYFELVETATGVDEPWKVYLDFSGKILRALVDEKDSSLQLPIRLISSARRHLWHVGYLYCRRSKSRRIADTVFDGSSTAVKELSAILF
jgi:hypothetical protein